IVAMDPPEHTRLRATCRHAFTARTVARLRDRAAALAHELIDAAARHETFDAVADFAVPYTLRMICALLGVPYADSDRFRRGADVGGAGVEELLRFGRLEADGASPRYGGVGVVLSGARVPAGAPVVAATVAANRDPRVFAGPHRLDLGRDPNPHLGFGLGAH